jgi:O-antigen ligase
MRSGAEAAGLRERAAPGNTSIAKKQAALPFSLLLAYLFLEYGRPQDILSFLRVLRLPGITVGLLTASMVAFGKFRLKGRQSTLFVLLLVLMVIHGPIATNNYWALMIFIAMAMNFVVFLALTHLVDQPEKYDRLVKVWLGIHVFLSIIGIVKQGRGIGGFLNDENDFCLAMNMVIPLSFFLAMNETGKKRLYFLVVTALFLFVIILTGSRGGFVGLCVSMLYCWLKTKRKLLTALIMGMLAVAAVLVAPSSYWDEVRSIAEEGTSKGTGAERMYTWGVGWRMFLDNPVMGVGQGNFPYVFRKYEVEAGHGEEGYHGRSVAGRAAHSIYFTMLPELGIVGTGIILLMVFHMFKDLKTIKSRSGRAGPRKYRRPDPLSNRSYALALGLEGGLISFLVSGAFISVLYYPNVWVLMGFIASLETISSQETDPSAA